MKVTTELFPDGTGEDFHVISMAVRATYARSLTDRLKIGGSINYVRDKIAEMGISLIDHKNRTLWMKKEEINAEKEN